MFRSQHAAFMQHPGHCMRSMLGAYYPQVPVQLVHPAHPARQAERGHEYASGVMCNARSQPACLAGRQATFQALLQIAQQPWRRQASNMHATIMRDALHAGRDAQTVSIPESAWLACND
jgi:hypothetical protein